MLPDIGTRERDALEDEAMTLGMAFLHEADGRIADALYNVYSHFRERFIEAYDLMDRAPGGSRWNEALTDARRLEHHVAECWATDIVNSHTLRNSVARRPLV